MALKIKAARGVLWSLLEYGGGEGISFIVFLVLARLLAPDSFGVVALAGVFVAFAQVFLVQGFSDAVIQRQDLRPEHLDTAFWTNQAIAASFFVLTQIVARPAAATFEQPVHEHVLRWLSRVFVSSALISTHQAVFKRELRFAAFALRALIGISVGGVVGVGMALFGWGVWSLVGQQLANGVASVLVIWTTSSWRPRLRFSGAAFRELVRFAAHVMGSNLVGFLYRKLDVFLIGLFLDARQLGYYYLVQRLMMTAGLVTLSTVQSIVMPVLSRLQGDPARFRQVYGSTVQAVDSIFLPAVVGLGTVGSLLIPFVFGEKWRPAIEIFEIMCLAGFTLGLTFFTGPALWAVGRPDAHFRLSIVQVVVTALVFLTGAQFGLTGVAVGFTTVTTLMIPFHLAVLRRHTGVDPLDLLKRCLPASIAGLVMIFAVESSEIHLVADWGTFHAAGALVLIGAAVYLVTLSIAAPRFVREMIDLLLAAFGRRSAIPPTDQAAAGTSMP
jgi:O-antigen/teichoic acid export membrane protein